MGMGAQRLAIQRSRVLIHVPVLSRLRLRDERTTKPGATECDVSLSESHQLSCGREGQ